MFLEFQGFLDYGSDPIGPLLRRIFRAHPYGDLKRALKIVTKAVLTYQDLLDVADGNVLKLPEYDGPPYVWVAEFQFPGERNLNVHIQCRWEDMYIVSLEGDAESVLRAAEAAQRGASYSPIWSELVPLNRRFGRIRRGRELAR